MELTGKIAIVTGAASGLGETIARRLVRGHAVVALVDKSDSVLQLEQELRAEPDAVAVAFCGDVTDAAFRRHVFESMSAYGLVRILIPCAGITGNGFLVAQDRARGKFVLYDDAEYDRVVAINQKAPTFWAAEMISRIAAYRKSAQLADWSLPEEQQGVIVFFGSIVGDDGNLGQVAYGETKAALDNLRKTLNKEARKHGVFATIVKPGFVDTPMVRAVPAKVLDKIIAQIPIGRLLQPDEIADVVVDLIRNPLHDPSRRIDGGLKLAA
jgi:NAD(P)-dependent dehydrogenase (short-subunit alcohol dehydrogenase family)